MLRKIIPAAILIILLFPSCGVENPPTARMQRLIDELRDLDILESPYLSETIPCQDGPFLPTNSEVLEEMGITKIGLRIKHKLKIGGTTHNALAAPPKSKFRLDINIDNPSYIKFGIGILQPEKRVERQELLSPDRGVTFLVAVESAGRKKTLFQRHVTLLSAFDGPTYSHYRLDLPDTPAKASLILTTEGDSRHQAYWLNPVVYSRDQGTRKVILVSIDTLRADHLGCYGYERPTSPNLDRLAEDSTIFLNTFVSSPWTLPSHVSMLTGLHGLNHQVYHGDDRMDPGIMTLAESLKAAGFGTAALTGGGFVSSSYGFSKGFETYNDGVGDFFREDSAEFLFRLTEGWLERNWDKDFFLFLHTYQTHNPYACPDPFKTMFVEENARWQNIDLMNFLGGYAGVFDPLSQSERENIVALYDGEIRYTDERLIGALVTKLKDLGIYDQTFLIITSDHGEEFFDHGGWMHGHSLYNESLKVPLVMKFPSSSYRSNTVHAMVNLVDVMPTILDYWRLNTSNLPLDGQSLIPVLEGKDGKDRPLQADVAGNVHGSHIPSKFAISRGRKKLILNQKFSAEDLNFFTTPPPVLGALEFYDLVKDPNETRSNPGADTILVRQLAQTISELKRRVVPKQTEKAKMDKTLHEQLRALGYIK
ncbi:MAG: sulfatase [Candidatus Aminicenantes bacterium]|jgi:arylsulfatase A-like enzyme